MKHKSPAPRLNSPDRAWRRVLCCRPEASGPYRYWLEVQVAERGQRLAVILKNPSTADAGRSDPTMGKVEAWARRHGFGSVVIVNLFARRSTDPSHLNRFDYMDAVGPENDRYLAEAASAADIVIAAWGNPNGIERERYDRRIAEVLRLLPGRTMKVIGSLTQAGYPRHGLWWNGQGNWEMARWFFGLRRDDG